jgi:hypothetical protein
VGNSEKIQLVIFKIQYYGGELLIFIGETELKRLTFAARYTSRNQRREPRKPKRKNSLRKPKPHVDAGGPWR